MVHFSTACEYFGLTISTKKTEDMCKPTPAAPLTKPAITVGDQKLAVDDNFTYLGSTLSRTVAIDDDVIYRIKHAGTAFCTLHVSVWEQRGISLQTKLKVFCAFLLPSLLYTCETWTVYTHHAKQLYFFHRKCLRKLLPIKWQDRKPDMEVLQRVDIVTTYAMLKRSPLRWAGLVCCKSVECIP